MKVTVPQGMSLKIVAAAAATNHVDDLRNWICLSLDRMSIAAVDGAILAHAPVEIEHGDMFELRVLGKSGEILFKPDRPIPKGWWQLPVEIDFEKGLICAKGKNPMLMHYPNCRFKSWLAWERVSTHLGKFSPSKNITSDGEFIVDNTILSRIGPFPMKVEIQTTENSSLRITVYDSSMCDVIAAYVTVQPIYPQRDKSKKR